VTRGIDRAICAASLVVALLALFAAVRWTREHPWPMWFDEANYVIQVFDDRQAFLRGGPIALLKSLVFADSVRPPAYRALAAPIAAATLPSLTLLRMLALGVTMAALVLLWRACRAVASLPSSLLATAMVFATPGVLASGAWYGTEYPLMFAIAWLLHAIVRRSPVGVAGAMALGLLAKTTFVFIGAPAMLLALIAGRHDPKEIRRLLIASACGVIVALSWWGWHVASGLEFAQYGRTYQRAAIAAPLSFPAFGTKLRILILGIGIPFVVAIALLLLRRAEAMSSEARRAVLVATAAVVPLVLVAMLSPVFVLRHFAPALLALALPLAVMLDRARPAIRVAVATLALIQGATIGASLPQVDHTDWTRLRDVIPEPSPRIAFLGGWPSLSQPEIRYDFMRDGKGDVAATWLWRSDEGEIDWATAMREVMRSDAVLVIPPAALLTRTDYERQDNLHNAELISRVRATGAFEEAVPFRIGTLEPVDALLFKHLR
jgi:hypothetical protein